MAASAEVAATSLAVMDSLVTEAEICGRFRHLLSARELRLARQRGEIAFFSGKKGAVLYHPEEVAEWLQKKRRPATVRESSNIAGTGSEPLLPRPASTLTGMTQEAEELAADHLARKYSTRPSAGSSNSRERRAPASVHPTR